MRRDWLFNVCLLVCVSTLYIRDLVLNCRSAKVSIQVLSNANVALILQSHWLLAVADLDRQDCRCRSSRTPKTSDQLA